MRAAPIGYALDKLSAVLKEAGISCMYTHDHREAMQGAKAVAGCVYLANAGANMQDIRKFTTKCMVTSSILR